MNPVPLFWAHVDKTGSQFTPILNDTGKVTLTLLLAVTATFPPWLVAE